MRDLIILCEFFVDTPYPNVEYVPHVGNSNKGLLTFAAVLMLYPGDPGEPGVPRSPFSPCQEKLNDNNMMECYGILHRSVVD